MRKCKANMYLRVPLLTIFQMNDQQLGMSRIKVVHALQAIVKPTAKSNEAAQKYVCSPVIT